MADKILNTRVQLKYDSLANWSTKNPTLLSGELAIVYLGNSNTTTTPDNGTHPILFKVGPGEFNSLPFASALAADVYSWAKETGLTITKDGTGNVVSGIEWDATANNGKGGIKFTTAAVATAEGLEELQEEIYGDNANGKSRIDLIEEDIAANRADWAEKTVDTNTDTQYTFSTDGDKLVVYKTLYTLGVAGTAEKVGEYEFLTAAEVATTLENYYTKGEIDTLTSGKLHTEDDIKTIAATEIGRLIDASGDAETLKSIGDLVDYAEKNAGDIAELITSVGTANTNASNAIETANGAAEVAGSASTVAGEAKELAEEAKEAAITAQNSASASAQAAAASAEAAEASADLAEERAEAAGGHASAALTSAQDALQAQTKAETAQSKAETALLNAEIAQTKAEAAQTKAEEAQSAAATSEQNAKTSETNAGNSASAASAAQVKAESAQAAAEQAKADAEAAKQAALDSNTSATAIAGAAKAEAEAATAASNAATQAVAGLHDMATSGDLYDSENVGTAKNTAGTDVPCLIFYCGTASDLI